MSKWIFFRFRCLWFIAFSKVDIYLSSDEKNIEIIIKDDGPGFPQDVIEILGEPYIKSKSPEIIDNAGTGLGTFLGKTLLERRGAKLSFLNDKNNKGASVKIFWECKDLII